MHEMTKHYLIAALWSSTDQSNEQGGDPLDQNYDLEDIAQESIDQAERDCLAFLSTYLDVIGTHYEQAGHDFWLTRNRHGVGFWECDRPWGENGRILSNAAHAFRELSPVVGDNGKIYFE